MPVRYKSSRVNIGKEIRIIEARVLTRKLDR
jgi:hypothetical protein